MDIILASPVTFALIAANIAISLIGFSDKKFLSENLLSTVGVLERKQYQRVVTSGFLHANEMHLFVNMITLYFFGPIVEANMGPVNFAIIYLVSLLLGSGWALMENRQNPYYSALGASGAVSGIVLAGCLLFPTQWLLLFFVIPIPMVLFAILYIVGSAYLSGRENRVVAHEAHLGGALGGAIATIIIAPQTWGNFIRALTDLLSF